MYVLVDSDLKLLLKFFKYFLFLIEWSFFSDVFNTDLVCESKILNYKTIRDKEEKNKFLKVWLKVLQINSETNTDSNINFVILEDCFKFSLNVS